MRALIAAAILAGTLSGLAAYPAQARGGGHGGASGGHFAVASPGRSGIVSGNRTGGRVFFDQGSGRFFVVDGNSVVRAGPPVRSGSLDGRSGSFDGRSGFFDGLGGGGVLGVGDAGIVSAPPSGRSVSQLLVGSATPASAQIAANLPPCNETAPSGVLIMRGGACSRAAR
jgi:hypothetical protein